MLQILRVLMRREHHEASPRKREKRSLRKLLLLKEHRETIMVASIRNTRNTAICVSFLSQIQEPTKRHNKKYGFDQDQIKGNFDKYSKKIRGLAGRHKKKALPEKLKSR